MTQRGISWNGDVSSSPVVNEVRLKLLKLVEIRSELAPVPLEFLGFGPRSSHGGHSYALLSAPHLKHSGDGWIFWTSSSVHDDPVRAYGAVLLQDGAAVELLEWRDAPRILQMFVGGKYIGHIEERRQFERDDRWWTKLRKSFTVPRHWDVETVGGPAGTIDSTAGVWSKTILRLQFDQFSLPVHVSRHSSKLLPDEITDFRDPVYLGNRDLVVPYGIPRVDKEMFTLLFCVNVAFRTHFLSLDFF